MYQFQSDFELKKVLISNRYDIIETANKYKLVFFFFFLFLATKAGKIDNFFFLQPNECVL